MDAHAPCAGQALDPRKLWGGGGHGYRPVFQGVMRGLENMSAAPGPGIIKNKGRHAFCLHIPNQKVKFCTRVYILSSTQAPLSG